MSRAEPTRAANEERDERIGAILNAYIDQRARGEAMTEAELLAKHPELADELREHLELLRDLRPASDRIESLINQGILLPCDEPPFRAALGPYRITEVIGRGGMGIVLKAIDTALNRNVALKILRPDLAEDPRALARFAREAKAAAALQHPNIVTVYSVGQERGVYYLAMEHVSGTNLADLLRARGALPAETTRHIFNQLLIGLETAHRAGLIHRDIKPSNILLEVLPGEKSDDQGNGQTQPDPTTVPTAESGAAVRRAGARTAMSSGESAPAFTGGFSPTCRFNCKIADFGLARMRSSMTQLTLGPAALGTPEYMSPEQARGDEQLDQRSDLYSAGIVLYEMLTGRAPFRADTATATLHRIATEEPLNPRRLSSDVDPQLARLATRLMSKRPADRFATAAEARSALLAGKRIHEPAELRRRVRRTLSVLTAAAALALLVWWGWRPAAERGESDWAGAPITAVWVSESSPTQVLARYGHDGPVRLFCRFPDAAQSAISPVMLDLTGHGELCVVAGTARPLDGHNVFAFDADGREIWRTSLSSDIHWPDCAPPSKWSCSSLLAANLDGAPGDEVLAVTKDPFEYPTRLSLIDPRECEVRSSFWHMGVIEITGLAPDFFGPGLPAILATGLNNKLDGFARPLPDDPLPVTRYDFVSVAMMLDPADMDGLAPPRTRRVPGIQPARPYAYAFLDLPPVTNASYVAPDGEQRIFPAPAETIAVTGLELTTRTRVDEEGAWLAVPLKRGGERPGPGLLELDRDMEIVGLIVGSGETVARSMEYWQRYWHPLVQRRRDVRCVWLNRKPTTQRAAVSADHPHLEAVWIDESDFTRVLARYNGIPESLVFRRFPTQVVQAHVIERDANNSPGVAIGLFKPPDGRCLAAFDATGNELWGLDLSSKLRWPDCAPPTIWDCRAVIAAPIDSEPGDELVVSAHDSIEYATRVSIVDTRSGTIVSTFWHMGRIHHLHVEPDFFGPGQPAILASGVNNKLDGFRQPEPDDPPPVTGYDMVAVVMILDPRKMDGLGPPVTGRMPDVRAADVHAYAYLDLPADRLGTYIPPGKTERVAPETWEIAFVEKIELAPYRVPDNSGPWFALDIHRAFPDGSTQCRAFLTVDRDLRLRHVVIVTDDEGRAREEYWQEHWHILIGDHAEASR